MTDPRLNSVHLAFPRRENFRRAREVLLQSRGPATQQIELDHEAMGRPSDTFMDLDDQVPRELVPSRFGVMEHGRLHPLQVGVNTVGRLPDNDVVLDDPCVSRRHCAILVHATRGCEVYDVASKNGTFVNGARVTAPTRLKPGDEILLSDLRLTLTGADGLVPSSPEAAPTL